MTAVFVNVLCGRILDRILIYPCVRVYICIYPCMNVFVFLIDSDFLFAIDL